MVKYFCLFFLCASTIAHDFKEVDKTLFPSEKKWEIGPSVPYPDDAIDTAFESHGNYWALAPSKKKKGQTIVLVLKANEPNRWVEDTFSGVEGGKWRWIAADMFGFIWISDGLKVLRINIKTPQIGPANFSADSTFPEGKITAMGLGPNGKMMFALSSGKIVEAHRSYNKNQKRFQNEITVFESPQNVRHIVTDENGDLWLKLKGNKVFKKAASENAWQRYWEQVWFLPGGSHDLSGDVFNGCFYMSWAISGDFGYPSTGKFHNKILEFNPKSGWRIFADYGYPRGYGGTSFLDGKIWAVGGDALDKEGNRYSTQEVLIFDPVSGEKSLGPTLPAELPAANSYNVNDRLYTLGYSKGLNAPLKLYSIGVGENQWTEEKDGPIGHGSSYGTQMDGVLYTVIDKGDLVIYDTKTKTWSTTKVPNKTRSPQVGYYRGEIYVMGGRNKESEAATYIFNPKTKKWRRGIDLPRKLSWGCAFNINGNMYVSGGFSYNNTFSHRTFRYRGIK
ncbi:MAG: hypothetical protein MK193_14710 [Lentisphaeria bacterium]|nr:hypothetical protein [Lentisphaeria bacterium]